MSMPEGTTISPAFAVVGASGFVGLRIVEILSARNDCALIPVLRSASSLAVISRQRLVWRIADFLNVELLTPALRGCAVCIHAAIGDARQIPRMAEVAYRACAAAGVRRLVWLSSASVHGQDCPPGTDESCGLHVRHPLVYNNAKVRAERQLARLTRDRRVEVVVLRPSVVFGPRSRWIADAAVDLRAGRAAWLNAGSGVCNSIYIDNLVEAIRLAATVPAAAGESFLVGDAESVSWADFYLPIASHLGFEASSFHNLQTPRLVPERESRMAALTLTPIYAQFSSLVPSRAKRLVKAINSAWPEPLSRSAWALRTGPSTPQLSAEHALLQQCRWKLPHAKAARILGYDPLVTFAEGMRRSLSWLDFAGLGCS